MAWSEAITEAFKFLNKIFIGPRKQIERVIKIYDSMNKAIIETNAERFLIIKIHNGGTVITPTGEIYASTIYEDYTHPFRSVKAEYQRVPVDKAFMKMVLEIMQNKRMIYSFDTMPEGIAKDIYEKEGVKSAVLYYLGQDRKNVYICSCGSSKNVSWTTGSGQLITLDLAVNVIRQNIK